MFEIKAELETRSRSIVAYVNEELVRYYRSLIPKYYYVSSQKYRAHATVVRSGELENIPKIYSGPITILYSPVIYHKEPYFWINCWSDDIAKIREELGLKKFRFWDQTAYHITIGNTKNEI